MQPRAASMESYIDPRLLLLLASPFIGSFLSVVVERQPSARSVLVGRSACPSCGHKLGPRDLLPLVSWLVHRAKCRYCGRPISVIYPAIEIAALLVAIWSLAMLPGSIAWAGCGLGWTLLTLAIIDQRWYRLPLEITLPLALAGALATWLIDPAALLDHLAGWLAGVLTFAAVGWLYWRLRGREGLGEGDIWLLGALGAWTGWQGLPSIVLYACISGLLWAGLRAQLGKRFHLQARLPFGPHLCLAGWLVWLYGPLQLG
jgi:leader peptidase (prepilin peptidase) / N-methyltransferase